MKTKKVKAYQVIKDCSISFVKNGRDVGFALYEGDYFFIGHDSVWIKHDVYDDHILADILLKIYHNKMIDLDGNKEWTWVNVNLADPKINGKRPISDSVNFSPIFGEPVCKDVSLQWERDRKLNQVI